MYALTKLEHTNQQQTTIVGRTAYSRVYSSKTHAFIADFFLFFRIRILIINIFKFNIPTLFSRAFLMVCFVFPILLISAHNFYIQTHTKFF